MLIGLIPYIIPLLPGLIPELISTLNCNFPGFEGQGRNEGRGGSLVPRPSSLVGKGSTAREDGLGTRLERVRKGLGE